MILPELAVCGLPLPLGGTSNHFRMEALRHAGGWDPFNVTEDADLGCRLVRLGYRTETLASRTYEEAVVKLAPWMKQRRRWLKGFLHTWLVHMRRPRRLLRDMGLSCFLTFQCMSLGIFGTALLHPFLAAAGFWYFLSGAARHDSVSASHAVVVGLAGALLLTGYGAGIACAQRGLRRLGHFGWWFTLASMPFYWALMMPAAWLALWDFAVRPHHWHKTPHGLSRLLRRTAQKPRQTRGINRASAP
jgi:cellulose synthase/poly-beta-1,6-N-acetylglucosamine synthase-like glycosyltransferase